MCFARSDSTEVRKAPDEIGIANAGSDVEHFRVHPVLAPLTIIGEGTNEIQRNVIASQLVKRGGLDV
ncbi:hypothetical protein AV521_03365 [Streptomyces sp. IMTB 2501]|nr:hypothetical protein AV521_03365 [Streptomyces sp. IMTB 2501]